MDVLDTLILALQQPKSTAFQRAVLLLLLLGIAAIVLARLLVVFNRAGLRRMRADDRAQSRRSRQRRRPDAWAEAGRRVPLEDDPDVPRESPDDSPHDRGFHDPR